MLDRTTPPKQQELKTVILPTAKVITLKNGSRLHLIENSLQPVVRVEIVLKAGKWYEPSPGTSFLLSKMLLEGTASYSAKELAETIAYYGAALDCQQGYDRMTITLYCLSKYFDRLLPVLKEVLQTPTLGSAELEIQKRIAIQNLQVEKRKNNYLSTKRFTQNLFGYSHPYAAGIEEEQIKDLNAAQLKEYHHTAFNSVETEIFLCGDVNETIIHKFEDLILQKKERNNYGSTIKVSQGPQQDEILLPESLQSSIRVGRFWPTLEAPNYHKLSLLNKVLGGYFGSRLMKNIREDKGFTYGISASVNPRERYNLLVIGTDVNFQSTDQTLHEIYNELEILQKVAIPQEELDTVKAYTIGKFLGDTNTIFEQTDRYKTIVLHNLPSNFYSTFITDISNTQSDELQVLAQEYYKKEIFIEVVAGRRT